MSERTETSLLERRVRDVPLAVLDLELTGLSPQADRICEVAVVRGQVGRVDGELQSLVRPRAPMSQGALACHGLTGSMLAGAPTFGEVAQDVVGMLEGAVVVAHNVPFDLGFLHRELEEAGLPLAPPVTLDTLLMARRLFAFPKNNLGEVCEALGVVLEQAHRALADARATFAVFSRMIEVLDPEGTLTVGELSELVEALAPNSPLRLRQQKLLREAFRDRHTVWIDYQSTSDPTAGVIPREVAIWVLRFPRIQGWCHLREAERVFRVDRMRRVRRGERKYEVPDDVEPRI